jgi:hypothetical protein
MDEKALDAPKAVKEALAKKSSKGTKEEAKGEPVEAADDDAFTTVEEKGGRMNRDKKP